MADQPPFVADLHPRIAKGNFALGTWVTMLDPAVPELLAGAGYDLLIVDGEHGPAATSDLARILIATRASGVPVLYRVGANEPVRIMHALDAGASGVVVPQIRTVADAERAVAWCRYPPAGLRGIAPRRASGYGRGTGAYMAAANALVTCCIQIETREALADLDAILAVPGIDTILIGPNDLAAAMGHIGDLAHPDVETAIRHVGERGQAAGVPVGAWAGSTEQARTRRDQGYAWATVGSDYAFMVAAADAAVREVAEG
jgi:4-hydroxy-2-oxoheptanedioate aldolase